MVCYVDKKYNPSNYNLMNGESVVMCGLGFLECEPELSYRAWACVSCSVGCLHMTITGKAIRKILAWATFGALMAFAALLENMSKVLG